MVVVVVFGKTRGGTKANLVLLERMFAKKAVENVSLPFLYHSFRAMSTQNFLWNNGGIVKKKVYGMFSCY